MPQYVCAGLWCSADASRPSSYRWTESRLSSACLLAHRHLLGRISVLLSASPDTSTEEGGQALEVDLQEVPRQDSGRSTHALDHGTVQHRVK